MAVVLYSDGDAGLISLNRIRKVLFGDATKATTFDDQLQYYIGAVSERFEDECLQPVRRRSIVHEFLGNGTRRHTLAYHPVDTVVTLARRTAFDTWEAITTGAVVRRDDDGYFIDSEVTLSAGTAYRATISVGHTAVPNAVQTIIEQGVVLEWLDSPLGEGRLGKTSEATSGAEGTQAVTINLSREEYDARWKKLITTYRKRR